MDTNYFPTQAVLIQGATPNDLENMISRLLDKKLASISISHIEETKPKDGLFKRIAAAKRLQISTVTLDAWTKAGIINARRIGTRKYYTEKDLQDALKKVNG